MDEADPAAAWEAFERARQDDPDAPGLALLKVQMLFFDNRVDEARERAASGEAGQSLVDRVAEVEERLLPVFELVDSEAPVDEADMQAALRNRLHGMGVPAGEIDKAVAELTAQTEGLQELPPEGGAEETDIDEEPEGDTHRLMPPPDLVAVEASWHEVCPVSKPFSIQPDPFQTEDI